MSRRFFLPALAMATCLAAAPAFASLCDFRLSQVIAARAPALAAAAVDPTALAALGAQDRDFLTLVDGQSGMSALGAIVAIAGQGQAVATMAGAASGTAQLIGAGGTVLSGPAIGMAAGAAALGLGGLEGLCRFNDERITDYYEVLALLSVVAETADPKLFQLQLGPSRKRGAVVEVWDKKTQVRQQFKVSDLIFVNGALVQSRWGPNRNLGYLMQFENASVEFPMPKGQ